MDDLETPVGRLEFFITWYLPGIPLFAVFLAGLVLASVTWRRHPKVSLVTLITFTLATTRFIVQPLLLDWFNNKTMELERSETRPYFLAIQFAIGLLDACEFALLLMAIFGWRSESPVLSGKAAASLVLGFLSLPLSILAGIPAILLGIFGLREIKQSAGKVKGKGLAITGIIVAIVAMVTPLIAAAVILPRIRLAAVKLQSSNHLKQIGIGMHMYNDTYEGLPPAVLRGPTGQPYSWRVALLPFIEEHGLYSQYNRNEPWDSPGNRALLNKMPKVYAPPGRDAGDSTYYQVLVGPGTAFESPALSLKLQRDFPKGMSETILIVEAETAVPWTKPEDLTYEPGRPLPRLGGIFPSGFHVCFVDGSVRWFDQSEATQLGQWVTRK